MALAFDVARSLMLTTIVVAGASCGGAVPAIALVPVSSAVTLAPLTFATLDNQPITVGGSAGQRITVIDVWASYCKPCRTAFPKLNRLQSQHPEIAVIGLTVDEAEAPVQQFLREVPTTITIARDPALTVKNPPLSMKALPTLLVIDAAGRIRFRADEAKETDYDGLPALIAQLAAETM